MGLDLGRDPAPVGKRASRIALGPGRPGRPAHVRPVGTEVVVVVPAFDAGREAQALVECRDRARVFDERRRGRGEHPPGAHRLRLLLGTLGVGDDLLEHRPALAEVAREDQDPAERGLDVEVVAVLRRLDRHQGGRTARRPRWRRRARRPSGTRRRRRPARWPARRPSLRRAAASSQEIASSATAMRLSSGSPSRCRVRDQVRGRRRRPRRSAPRRAAGRSRPGSARPPPRCGRSRRARCRTGS